MLVIDKRSNDNNRYYVGGCKLGYCVRDSQNDDNIIHGTTDKNFWRVRSIASSMNYQIKNSKKCISDLKDKSGNN